MGSLMRRPGYQTRADLAIGRLHLDDCFPRSRPNLVYQVPSASGLTQRKDKGMVSAMELASYQSVHLEQWPRGAKRN